MPDWLKDWLLSQDVLQELAGRSIADRTLLVEQRFGFRLSVTQLRLFYREHGVKFVNAQMCYRQAMVRHEELNDRRLDYAVQLAHHIRVGDEVLFLDEAAVNSFAYQKKAWQKGSQTVDIPINKTRFGVTVFGCIGTGLRRSQWMLAKGTTGESFLQFLRQIVPQLHGRSGRRPRLVIDNASAHHAKVAKSFLGEHFDVMWLPPYSPQLNR